MIEQYLHKLSEDFNIEYNDIVEDFNIYNCYEWNIEEE
jgi:hypothetical protein